MKEKILAMLLAAVIAMGLLPGTAWAADTDLPDWYFLFAIFKNVDADCYDGNGVTTHTTYTMTQKEVDLAREHAKQFEVYMKQVGVMRAHMEIVEIDTPVTELAESGFGSYIAPEQAAPFLKDKVDLDRYDHVTCVANLNVDTRYSGITGSVFENGTGSSCANFVYAPYANPVFPESLYVHEFLHFMEFMSKKWGVEFDLHGIGDKFYAPNDDEWKVCYTDIILNRVEGDIETGTGVSPAVWQYPPHVLRTIRELTIPESVTTIDNLNFQSWPNLERVTISSGVTDIGESAFIECRNLTSVTIPNSVTSIGSWAFAACSGLTGLTIPNSVTMIGAYAFEQCGNLTGIDVASGNPAYISVDGILFSADQTLLHTYPAGRSGSYAIPASVTSIGNGAFHGARGLTDVTIPDGVTSIGDWAFTRCCSLTSVTIPDSVTSIGDVAFFDTGLKIVYYGGTEDQWAEISIGDGNEPLLNANIYYGSHEPTEPSEPGTPEITFNDVPAGSWYESAVSFAAERGLLEGDGKGNFNPNDKLTRAQTFAILARLDGKTVTGGNWIETATQWAVGKGVSTGENSGSDVTREQLVVMLWRYKGEPGADTSKLSGYPDRAYLHDWGVTAMAWAVNTGIIEGSDGWLNPQGTATRAQAVTMIQRYCANL